MRSIHKKTLKRFLSTLLALTMVLGMVPFTALAAPANGYNLTVTAPDYVAVGQTVDASSTLTGLTGANTYDAYVTIEVTRPAGANPKILATDTTSGIVYNLAATTPAGTPDMDGTVSSGGVWGDPSTGFTVYESNSATTPLKLTFNKAGTYTATFTLVEVGTNAVICSGTKTITVVGFTSLAASPANPQIGTDFTVTAETTATSGTVQFSYGSQTRIAAVGTTDGKATAAFTAEASQTEVVAILSGISGVDAVTKTTTITLDPADTYYDVTFLPGAVGAYIPFSPTTVSVEAGGSYTIPTAIPTREGYTFKGWDSDGNSATVEYSYNYNGSAYTPSAVAPTADMTLNAVWEENDTYSVTYSSGVTGVVTGMPDSVTGIAYGSSYIISNAEPSRVGYTFKGWALTADATAANDTYAPGKSITVTANVNLYAVWELNTVKVTLPDNGTGYTIASSTLDVGGIKSVTEGSTQTFTVTLTEGYDPSTLVVTANGVALAPVLTNVANRVYTYSFVANVDTQILVSTPKLLKYTITLPTGEHFTANFTAPSEAAGKGSYTFDYGTTTAEFTVQLKDGYTGKVYIDGVAQPEIAKNGTGTYTLHATGGGIKHVCDIRVETAKVQTFTVTYTIDGQAYTTRTVDAGTAVNTLSNIAVPAKTGYTFGGWYSDTGLTTALDNTADTEKVTGDMEVYGKWTPVEGKIQYNLNSGSGSFADQTKFYGQALQLHPDIPTREGYTFKGWATVDGGAAVYQPGDMYSTEIGTSTVTLYAVWEQITFTVTLPSGTGYTVSSNQSTTVEWDKDFAFTITVDRAYAATKPTVKVNGNDVTADITGTTETSKEATWSYTIKNIKEDKVVSITVVMNQTYTVTLAYDTTDDNATYENKTFRTLEVEHGYKVTQPEAPSVPGYEFVGWMDSTKADTYDFSTPVTAPTIIYAQMKPIVPKVTWTNEADDGWNIDVTNATLVGETALNVSPNAVAYGSDMTFTITVDEGWDASKMQVAANGAALSAVEIDTTTSAPAVVYKYLLSNITANTNITVVGVERKTVTITYNANARDDVSGMPEQQVVKYYLSDTDCDKLSALEPVRTGYEFLGWNTDPAETTATHVAGADANFKTDTTLYAIWEAVGTTVALKIEGDYYNGNGALIDQFEGEQIKLIATITPSDGSTSVEGTVVFYYQPIRFIPDKLEELERVTITSDNVAVVDVTVGQFYNETDSDKSNVKDWLETYWVEFIPKADEGFGKSVNSELECVRVWSKALAWATPGNLAIDANADMLKIYAADGTTLVDEMEANTVYWLEIPEVYPFNSPEMPKVGNDYQVVWEYLDPNNDWVELTTISNSDRLKVEAKYSQYSFRAKVYPTTNSIYTKAVEYDANGKIPENGSDVTYMDYLITKPTAAVVTKDTTTTLVIVNTDGKLTEAANVVINGATPFSADHLAQFEGDKITLKATVKETGTNAKVTTGTVKFYRYVDGISSDELLNIQDVALDSNGVATYTVEVDDYDTGKVVGGNIDQFYAVYEDLADDTTWTKSDSKAALAEIYIKSTAIQTPIIDSALSGKRGSVTGATSTSYTEDLTELQAGVKHTFTLKTTGATTAESANWSVVALDGRTVASTDYTIKWLATTGDNEEATVANGSSYTTSDNKVGDMFRVELVPTGDMKTGATSKYAKIGTKQDVNVTVTASDEIDSTTTGNPDVYQLNPITLTATVKAAEDDATVKPSGTVTFYYSVDSGSTWTKVGETTDLAEVAGVMTASIKTTELPVDATTNKQQNVKITAIYSGDKTFNESGTINSTGAITNTTGCTVNNETVTVYSSVVYVADNENKASGTVTDGINITANGSLVANETNVTLTLSDIYTLDHAIDLSKLVYGTDYTVQWQKLDNAIQNQDKDSSGNVISGSYATTDKWSDINGETGRSYTISSVVQDAAYRAEITVTGTPITKGSFTEVDQAVDGRKVYYSNVLVVGAGQATVTTNITTSANTKFNEEGIVEGETVTIHALVAGAANVTPISKMTATILPQGETDPAKAIFTAEEGNVDGYNAFVWDTTGVTPGYYTLTVVATSNNGYAPQTITRTLIVRDDNYTLTVDANSKVYNGKAQGIDWTLDGIDFAVDSDEYKLAQKSVVVYYYQNGKLVEPTQAGTYDYELILPASAYWTGNELTPVKGKFTIEQRTVNVVDLVAQAKVYDGTTDINELEVILNDSAVDGDGAATGDTGIINGDSIYATGVMTIDNAGAGERTLSVSDVTLHGHDKDNYVVGSTSYTETINVQRSQVKGDIANSTFKYTGSNITVPADDIYLIDQAGNVITPANYTVTYYYHNGDGVEKVTAMNKLGKYTVIARPEQNNYKGGASETIYVVEGAGTDATPTAPTSTLINITNTVELFGAAGNTGIVAAATNGATITKIEYQNGTGWTESRPTNAGRYLVKVTASTDDTAYGIYTIVKANPVLTLSARGAEYTSAQISGTPSGTYNGTYNGTNTGTVNGFPAGTYYTYTGGTIQGIAYEAPTEVGSYVVTAHIGETDNYTAHEVSANFAITKKALTITADDLQRWQYGSYPDMIAKFEGLATEGVAPDTSLRDVQIQPEFIFNDLNGDGQPEYTNSALDQVGVNYPITVRNALARNYEVSYVEGNYSVTEEEPKADLAIHGMIDNGTTTENIAYYGDQIQLYAYGNYKSNGDGTGVYNPSSLLEWSLSTGAPATIDEDGLLTIKGVGTFNVTLTRGSGDAKISTSIEITAKPKEVVVNVPDVDKVYNALEQTYDGTVTVEGRINGDTDSATLVAGDKRTNVGSQIVTYKVNTAKYVSETYGGLFTINDKEVTVAPVEQTKVYGTKEAYEAKDSVLTDKAYSETGVVGGKTALTTDGTNELGVVASVSDLYENIDVSNTGYEILVAGPENMNYNVKYTTDVTDGSTPDAQVTAKPLTVSTGTLNNNVGMTSGSLNPLGDYPVNGEEVDSTATLGTSNVRMYGEPNWVMDYALATLISGDSLADLDLDLEGAPLGSTLVDFSYNIGADANVKYEDKATKLKENNGAGTNDLPDYVVETGDSMIAFGNYNETYTEGTQNIYQRPVTLKLRDNMTALTAYQPAIMNGVTVKTDELLKLILNNLVVEKYNNSGTLEGGLAELLNHTIENLQITFATTPTYDQANKTITAKIKLGNQNYWIDGGEYMVTVKVDPTKVYAEYGPLGWTSATVTMKQLNENGSITYADLGNSNVWYYIYKKDAALADADQKYSSYKDREYERKVEMSYSGSNGLYIANYDRLSAGDYVMFAIVEGYTIIE